MAAEKLIHARVNPSASSSSFCSSNGVGLQDQNAFEKSRRAVISLRRCDETEVLAVKPSFGSKNERNKKVSSTANTVKRTGQTYPANVPRKPATSASHGKGNGKCNGSAVPVGGKGYKCLICTKKFTAKRHLSLHTRVHTGEKPYTCHVCAKRFSHKDGLRVHLMIHTGEKPYTCRHCPKAFSTISYLKTHLREHTGEKPYNCRYCSKSFRIYTSLASHLRTHTKEKPYVCHSCKRSFSFRTQLIRHLTLHTAGK